MTRGVVLLLAAALVLPGCAASKALRSAEQAERRRDWDRAVLEYSRALKLDPGHTASQRGLQRTRLRAAEAHAAAGRRLRAQGLLKEAADELHLALDLDPAADSLRQELRALEEQRRLGRTPPAVRELKARTRERALPGLALDPAAPPLSLTFRGASLREAYQALGRSAGINFVFDPAFQDQPVTLDLNDVQVEQALAALATTGRTFHRVLDAHVVSVIPDTSAKRREFEEQVVKTFYLSNAELKEAVDLLRVVLGARRVAPITAANALTINDTPEKVAAAERILEAIDKPRGEVVVDVEILEVNRSRLRDYGIEITSGLSAAQGVAGGIFPDPTTRNTLERNPYTTSNLLVSSLPGVIYRLLRSDASTHLLAAPQLRISEGQTAQARFGDQVPVPVTVFTPIATGGISQQPITSFEYKNVGVNIDLTPRLHDDGDVTLSLKLDISALAAASGFQGLPAFTSRQVTSVIRLRDGETNILAGLIRDSERQSLTGLPGLSSVPFLGRVFSRNQVEGQETDIVMTLTPHVVRRIELGERDLRSFSLGAGEASPLLYEAPSLPAGGDRLPSDKGEPGDAPGTSGPIRPPAPSPSPSPEGPVS
jgi:general secretion pathway protein D